jgi:hypothetical protein
MFELHKATTSEHSHTTFTLLGAREKAKQQLEQAFT